ncbi:DUF624 domain-containing protein [Clostridium sp. SHJSY1]|uniref:YesL family protein n=1 Tax=Clostridium sp. SHJSY1 TaxID=2942483 RepID=UPI0028746F31|nr:DUF624 domain-containing protein [Clostridium sp. SHJSY1]MDS0525784.1 DUF624 domain-containing protein [Clostridium sp. SHJSY1]
MNINGLFNPDNIFFRFMSRISDLMIINFLWIICSIPIVTIGASTTALYNVTLKLVDETEGYLFKNFFSSFRENFKKATILWFGILFAFFIIGVNIIFWIQFKSITGYIAICLVLFSLFIFLFTEVYIFPILSRSNKTIKDTVKDAFILSIRYLPYSLIITIVSLIFISILIIFPFTILFMIFVGFAFYAFINSYIFIAVFKKSMFYVEE